MSNLDSSAAAQEFYGVERNVCDVLSFRRYIPPNYVKAAVWGGNYEKYDLPSDPTGQHFMLVRKDVSH